VPFVAVLLLAVALAADAFSVAMASGLVCRGPRPTFRLAFHFGLFQGFMPALGALSGLFLRRWVAAVDHWIAFGLLAAIGLKMIVESFRREELVDGAEPRDPSRGLVMVGLSLATSIDAFGAGVGLAMAGAADLLLACVTIAVVTGALTIVGLRLGRAVGERFGPWAERLGGLVLIGLAFRLLVTM